MSQQRNVERLVDAAFDALEKSDLESAIKLGLELKRVRHSSAFEILGFAHAAGGRLDDAIAVLEEGLKAAPSVWSLWQLLGNYYSDQERLEKCMNSYRQALDCPDVDASSVHLNMSIALGRAGKYEEAIGAINQVTGEELEPHAICQTMFLLNCAERFSESEALGERVISSSPWGAQHDEQRATVYGELAEAVWRMRHDEGRALAHAWKAIGLDKCQRTAARVIREAAAAISPDSRRMTVLVCGRWPEPVEGEAEAPGFFASYEVVAETPEEALTFIRPFEPEGVRESLSVEECTIGEVAVDQQKGVHDVRRGYVYFPWED